MKQYQQLVREVLTEGNYKKNRTGVDSISKFGVSYTVDNSGRYPLLTTKKMDGYRWDSMIHELLWYLSGEEHIKNLREHTKIWDNWADDEGHLDTAYGRFWRRYPVPGVFNRKDGESWVNRQDQEEWMNQYNRQYREFDQLGYIIDELQENPNSRRLVVNAWHPANAAVSTLPPCHYSFVFNVQGNALNLHLTQRSGDVALGVPFNIACYTLLQRIIAQQVDLDVGEFHHSIVDAHIYCGKGERGEWWENNVNLLSEVKWGNEDTLRKYSIGEDAPEDPDNYDHIPGLLEQLSRQPKKKPRIEIADKTIDEIGYKDIQLKDYESHSPLKFGVAK